MRPISTRELRWLLGRHRGPCVSIYLPADRGADPAADRARYEARVAEAATLLRKGLTAAEVEKLLAPVREVSRERFWTRRTDALVVFRSQDTFTHYRIPANVPELTVVADTFHTRPIVRYLNSSRRHFYVLAFTDDRVELLEGNPERLTPIHPDDLPPELADALADPRGRAYLAAETAGRAAPARSPAAKGNGNGGGAEALQRYFRSVDRALWEWLRDDLAPVMLAGTPGHTRAYQAASRYPELLDEAIDRDVTALDATELHAAALHLIRQHDSDVLGAVLAQLSSALSSGRADADLRAIAKAAVVGGVRLLVFAADAQQWGKLDRRTGELELEERQRDDVDADVIDDLCEVVLLSGGDVHEVPPRTLPGPVAAIYRS